LEITVLGKSPSWQDADGACSGYLVEEDGYALVLDCGNGVFSKLREHRDYVDVDAVLITHLHADHLLDLIPFAYALTYAPRQQPVPVAGWPGTNDPARPDLYAPAGGRELFRHLGRCWQSQELIEDAFSLEEYEGTADVTAGPFRIRFCEVPHYTTTFAVELSNGSGTRFTFSADCSPNDALVNFARDTDLLLIEATLPRPERTGQRGHLTPAEAGDHARRAHAKQIVVTHFSDELDREWIRSEAAAAFGGEVELAHEGARYTV
jgi:ribonuclease BN (tRNA processing enzyme)